MIVALPGLFSYLFFNIIYEPAHEGIEGVYVHPKWKRFFYPSFDSHQAVDGTCN